jgi:hypothetical protein
MPSPYSGLTAAHNEFTNAPMHRKPKMKTLATTLVAALSIGTASAQYPTGQALVYSPPQAPVWSPPVTGYSAPYIPAPQPSFTLAPVYTPPVTGTVNPYSSRVR